MIREFAYGKCLPSYLFLEDMVVLKRTEVLWIAATRYFTG